MFNHALMELGLQEQQSIEKDAEKRVDLEFHLPFEQIGKVRRQNCSCS